MWTFATVPAEILASQRKYPILFYSILFGFLFSFYAENNNPSSDIFKCRLFLQYNIKSNNGLLIGLSRLAF